MSTASGNARNTWSFVVVHLLDLPGPLNNYFVVTRACDTYLKIENILFLTLSKLSELKENSFSGLVLRLVRIYLHCQPLQN